VDQFYDQGRSVIIACGHYNNWELVAVSGDMPLKHQAIGIYQKLSNPYFDKKMIETRGRFGMKLITTKQVKETFANEKNNLTATFFGMDQSPSPTATPHWMTFLNQDTAVQFGTEKYSKEYNYPVIFGRMRKIKRGFYTFEFELITDEPTKTLAGEITEKMTKLLEKDINRQPEYWLWSHKRWKLKRP
jgi:KDO2-lipid IV(A) lauroyltransferase